MKSTSYNFYSYFPIPVSYFCFAFLLSEFSAQFCQLPPWDAYSPACSPTLVDTMVPATTPALWTTMVPETPPALWTLWSQLQPQPCGQLWSLQLTDRWGSPPWDNGLHDYTEASLHLTYFHRPVYGVACGKISPPTATYKLCRPVPT